MGAFANKTEMVRRKEEAPLALTPKQRKDIRRLRKEAEDIASTPLTPKQRRLRKEIEDIASIFDMDHWNILDYEPRNRTFYLELTKNTLIRGQVIFRYTMVDQLLSTAICRYYFPARPPWVNKTSRNFGE